MTQALLMEDYFNPGFKAKPAVIIGSQTVPFFWGKPDEQAMEGFHIAASSARDLVVVRNIDPEFIKYWKTLMDNPYILNIDDIQTEGNYLTEVVLEREELQHQIKKNMSPDSNLMIFLPTFLEQQLAGKLGIPLHGSTQITNQYGTKSGIRRLAAEAGVPMSPGFICTTLEEVREAISILKKSFNSIVMKHDSSLSGFFSKKIESNNIGDISAHLTEISNGKFIESRDIVVVEGWLKNKASLCAHIEILENEDPIICAGWQQVLDKDEISYIGGGPLMLSKKAMNSFLNQLDKLAFALKEKGAIGSYGPDFLVISEEEENLEPDTCVLLELNARVPYTAFPLEIIKQIKGKIGSGFLSQHMKLKKQMTFSEIKNLLESEDLLITKNNKDAVGVVPFNIGMLKWNLFDIVIMADNWDEVMKVQEKVKNLFIPFQ